MVIVNSKEEILNKLWSAESEQEWTDICDATKGYTKTLPEEERSGEYPNWWFSEVVISGLMGTVKSTWRTKDASP